MIFQKPSESGGIPETVSQVFGGLDLVKLRDDKRDITVEMYLPKGMSSGVTVKVSRVSRKHIDYNRKKVKLILTVYTHMFLVRARGRCSSLLIRGQWTLRKYPGC